MRLFDQAKMAEKINHYRKSTIIEKVMLILNFVDEFVAQFKFTVLLMPNGPMKITGGQFDPNCYSSEYSIQDEDLKASDFISVLSITSPPLRVPLPSIQDDDLKASKHKTLVSSLTLSLCLKTFHAYPPYLSLHRPLSLKISK